MFEDSLDIKDKLFIIDHSNLDDVKILYSNYSNLIIDANDDDKEKFIILKNTTQLRIKELSKNDA